MPRVRWFIRLACRPTWVRGMVLACFVVSGAFPAHAQPIYRYVDEFGNVTYANTPMRGGKALKPLTRPASAPRPASPPPSAGKHATPSAVPLPRTPLVPPLPLPAPNGFPSVDHATQKHRDTGRRRILEDELNNEQRALQEAQRQVQEAAGDAKATARLRLLRDSVTEREKNIEALRRELRRAN